MLDYEAALARFGRHDPEQDARIVRDVTPDVLARAALSISDRWETEAVDYDLSNRTHAYISAKVRQEAK